MRGMASRQTGAVEHYEISVKSVSCCLIVLK